MKNIWKWIIIAAVLVGLIIGASVLYNKLSEDYKGDNLSPTTSNAETTSEEAEEPSSKTEENKYAAPDFTVLDMEGKEVSLSDFKGKPVVLNFWATWCYYCKEEMPDFNKAYKEFPDIQFLMVNATDGVKETKEKATKYVKEQGFNFPIFFDTKGEAVNNYHVTGFPTTYFIDADGNLVTYANGMINYETLKRVIDMIKE